MLDFKKLLNEIEKAENRNNEDEEIIRDLLEYASSSSKVIDFNLFKDIPSELIKRAINEVEKHTDSKPSPILKEMIVAQYMKENIEGFIPKNDLDEDIFF